jgi:hypothetical protein
MLYSLFINQKMCEDEQLSLNAVIVFEVIKQLSNLTYIQKKTSQNRIYTVLYRNMILDQIPHFKIKERTLGSAISELLEAGFIESLLSDKTPAYTFTEKADRYISSIKPNEGDLVFEQKTKKQPLFSLSKKTKATHLAPEYYKLLKEHSLVYGIKASVPKEEFDKFIDYHSSKGTEFENWLSAWRTWCRNYKKFNPNGGEKSTMGVLI